MGATPEPCTPETCPFVDPYDCRHSFICENGHHSIGLSHDYPVCTARSENPNGPFGSECGADVEYRVAPYDNRERS